MAKNVGWIKLFRKLIDNRMYFDEPFDKTHAWIDLLLNADKEGHLRVTIKELATRWKWSPNKVRRYIENLVSDDMVQIDGTIVGTKGGTILTLVKYKDFQLRQQNDGTKDGSNDGITEWGKGDIYNNNIYSRRKEEKNITPNTLTSITPNGGDTHTDYESEFEEVWKLYPKKQGKVNALKDYIKARKSGVSRKTIEDGITAYSDYCRRNDRFFKDGSTWFHQKCWEEDYSDDEPFKKVSGCDDLGYSVSEYAEQMKREGLL